MSDVLTEILASKQSRISRGEYGARPGTPARPSDGREFAAALRGPGTRIIAEFKAQSPSAGVLLSNAASKVESFALHYRRGRAAAISVVTEEDHFGGDPSWLPRVKAISGLPVLMKDFFFDERQLDFAASLGADAVLLIVRALGDGDVLPRLRRAAGDRGLAVVIEAHGAVEIRHAAAVAPDVLGVNARDLATFRTDVGSIDAMAREIPPGPVRLAESGIKTRADVERLTAAGYEAFLVGETLLRAPDPEEELRSLRG
jgi:indole-3-glycerol phosphate synthase